MNIDAKKSCQPCGCDEGANHVCEQHQKRMVLFPLPMHDGESLKDDAFESGGRPTGMEIFPADAAGRKTYPMFTGLLAYFPDALAAVANVSFKGNQQHNPGLPLHWAREKSTDQKDTAIRHQMDHALVNVRDTDGCYHLAKAIWRLCAELQLTIEKERA